jgi:hypothetical protein
VREQYQRANEVLAETEQPSPAVRAAVLAAAARQVHARPQPVGVRAPRWRVPLAAAASLLVGLLAVVLASRYDEPLPQTVNGDFSLRVLPPGSPNAPDPATDVEVDPDGEDPPDVLDSTMIDLTAYAFEHLALDLEPFPRKPGAQFTPPEESAEISPFAVLKAFKPRESGQ